MYQQGTPRVVCSNELVLLMAGGQLSVKEDLNLGGLHYL